MLRQSRVCALAAAVVAGLLASSTVLPAFAQDATPAPAANVPTGAAPAAAQPTPEEVAAAVQFLRASGLTTGFDDVIPQFIQQDASRFSSQRPELTSVVNEAAISLVPELMKKRAELDIKLATFYTTKFTPDELKELTAFYQTPVGQKFAKEQYEILRDSGPVVQDWTRDLNNDIMKRIREEVEKKVPAAFGGPAPNAPAAQAAPAVPAAPAP